MSFDMGDIGGLLLLGHVPAMFFSNCPPLSGVIPGTIQSLFHACFHMSYSYLTDVDAILVTKNILRNVQLYII